jgi:hypothetical protein
MACIYVCDFCKLPVEDQHFFFTCESRDIVDEESALISTVGAHAPLTKSKVAKAYIIHPYHFVTESEAVHTFISTDFTTLVVMASVPSEPVLPDVVPPTPEPQPIAQEADPMDHLSGGETATSEVVQ